MRTKYFVAVLLVCAFLQGCGVKEQEIEYIETEVKNSVLLETEYQTELEELTLESREVDKKGGLDTSYFLVESSNEYLRRSDRIKVVYRLSSDKKSWDLSKLELDNSYDSEITVLCELQEEQVLEDVLGDGDIENPFKYLLQGYGGYQVENILYDELDAVVQVQVEANPEATFVTGVGKLELLYSFNTYENQWKLVSMQEIGENTFSYDIEGTWHGEGSFFLEKEIFEITISNYDRNTNTFLADVNVHSEISTDLLTPFVRTGQVQGKLWIPNDQNEEANMWMEGMLTDEETGKEVQLNLSIKIPMKQETYVGGRTFGGGIAIGLEFVEVS